MNNPGIDVTNWERLKKRWSELEANGHKLAINFRLITASADDKNVLAIDVVQNINDEVITETVQQNAGQAYATLGIDGLSMEELVVAYKNKMRQLERQTTLKEGDLVVTMSPTSSTSGEIKGYVRKQDSDLVRSVPVNHQHYYLLTALREKLIGITGDAWKRVKAVYRSGDVEFYFDY